MTARTIRLTALQEPRPGKRPRTTDINPHVQLDRPSPRELQAALHHRIAALAGVTAGPSGISLPQIRGYHLPQPPGAAADRLHRRHRTYRMTTL